jgi:uncharacterized membrane protein
MRTTKKLAISGLIIAIYVVVMYLTQSFAFGQYQVRIATGLYALAYHFPFLVIPLGAANLLSNTVMGGLGIYDMLGGFAVGLLTAGSIVLLKKVTKNRFIVLLPIAIIPSLVVPIWLSILLSIPYLILIVSVGVGQFISAYSLGLFIVNYDFAKLIRDKH